MLLVTIRRHLRCAANAHDEARTRMPVTEYEVRVTTRGATSFACGSERNVGRWSTSSRWPRPGSPASAGPVRHDASHRRVHRGLLDWQGNAIRNEGVAEHVALAAALTAAIAALRANWPTYLADDLGRRP